MKKPQENREFANKASQIKLIRSAIARLFRQPAETHQYSWIERELRKAYRRIFPVPESPWTKGKTEDISVINLVPPEQLKAFFGSCIDFLRQIKGEKIGDYFEFGVFNGNSMASLIHAANKHHAHHMRFFGFDGFQGLPPGSEQEDEGVWEAGFYCCSYEEMIESIQKKGVNPEEVTFVKGWYQETLTPELAKAHDFSNIGIVMIDCDTYSSAKTVLKFLAPLIKQPCIVCLDDWKLYNTDVKGVGEYKAFNEFLEENPRLQAQEISSYNRKSKSFLIQLK